MLCIRRGCTARTTNRQGRGRGPKAKSRLTFRGLSKGRAKLGKLSKRDHVTDRAAEPAKESTKRATVLLLATTATTRANVGSRAISFSTTVTPVSTLAFAIAVTAAAAVTSVIVLPLPAVATATVRVPAATHGRRRRRRARWAWRVGRGRRTAKRSLRILGHKLRSDIGNHVAVNGAQ